MPSGSIEGRGMQAGNDNGDESGRQDEGPQSSGNLP
jgi:hypothetical protein